VIHILVADDHAVVREGVKRILADTNDLIVAGEASHGQEVLAKVAVEAWDIVLLDISMPGGNGLEILRQLKTTCPSLPVGKYPRRISHRHPQDRAGATLRQLHVCRAPGH
jgi:two-component system invasion response regulator UvrY